VGKDAMGSKESLQEGLLPWRCLAIFKESQLQYNSGDMLGDGCVEDASEVVLRATQLPQDLRLHFGCSIANFLLDTQRRCMELEESGQVLLMPSEPPVVANVVSIARDELPGGRMSDWQRTWCTAQNVDLYIQSRPGNLPAAGKLLAKALQWREENREVLTGKRIPQWQGDMRVFALGHHGHPILMMSMASQPGRTKASDIIDHTAAVLEAALHAMCQGVDQFDVVLNCKGFALWKNLDPRPVAGVMEMLKHPYRNRLRLGLIVGAPKAFNTLWNMAKGMMAQATREKIHFVSRTELISTLTRSAGADAAAVVQQELASPAPSGSWRFPSELGGSLAE